MLSATTLFLFSVFLLTSWQDTLVQAGPISRTSSKNITSYHIDRLHQNQLVGHVRSKNRGRLTKKQRAETIQKAIQLINAMKKSRFGG